jgi:ribosomal protein L24E
MLTETMTGAQLRQWRLERGLRCSDVSRMVGKYKNWCTQREREYAAKPVPADELHLLMVAATKLPKQHQPLDAPGIPRTGADLKAWREDRKVSARALSVQLRYTHRWASQREQEPDRALSHEARRRLAEWTESHALLTDAQDEAAAKVPRPCSQCGVSLLASVAVYPAERDGKVARCCSRACREKWLKAHKPRKRTNHLPSDSIWRRAACG